MRCPFCNLFHSPDDRGPRCRGRRDDTEGNCRGARRLDFSAQGREIRTAETERLQRPVSGGGAWKAARTAGGGSSENAMKCVAACAGWARATTENASKYAGRSQRTSIVRMAISTGVLASIRSTGLPRAVRAHLPILGIPLIRVSSRRPDLRFSCVAARAQKRGAVGRALSCAGPASTSTDIRLCVGWNYTCSLGQANFHFKFNHLRPVASESHYRCQSGHVRRPG